MYTVRGGKPETVLILRVTQTSACLPPNSMLTVLLQQGNPIESDIFYVYIPKKGLLLHLFGLLFFTYFAQQITVRHLNQYLCNYGVVVEEQKITNHKTFTYI